MKNLYERPDLEKSQSNVSNPEEEANSVRDKIGLYRQMCAQMGNNDLEFNFLDAILDDYNQGKITAKEAVRKAHLVVENKIER